VKTVPRELVVRPPVNPMRQEWMMSAPVRLVSLGVVAVVVLSSWAVNAARPVPGPQLVRTVPMSISGGAGPQLPWPAGAQAAIGVADSDASAATANPRPLPISSVAKVMTAVLVLKDRPLQPGQQGPQITVDAAAVQDYDTAQADGESTLPVETGEHLTEYQALQALLLQSANNIATLLARWVSGSVAAFVQQMNAMSQALRMGHTTFADAGGVSNQTVSTPADLTVLGRSAMSNPVLAAIVAQPNAALPVTGTVPNLDSALGTAGVVGLKAGSVPAPVGATFLFAGEEPVPGVGTVLIVGAVQALPTLADAYAAARGLLTAAASEIRLQTAVHRGQTVGRIQTASGALSPVVATGDLAVPTYFGSPITLRLRASAPRLPAAVGTVVGNLQAASGRASFSVPVATSQNLDSPSSLWRLLRSG
jgi:D-alanyl-D-alanine carboxypeptidase (penicillin-binding protein 5/6)